MNNLDEKADKIAVFIIVCLLAFWNSFIFYVIMEHKYKADNNKEEIIKLKNRVFELELKINKNE